MEFIEGDPIDQYCDQEKLPITERLQLFRKVCDAVEFAHRRPIVHRDLKPSNILVTKEGEPKLLDFGIAKALSEEEDSELSQLTRAGEGPMTPDYASPEQVHGDVVTTGTDVYSLGVVLYELLTGQRPVSRWISNETPKAPSAVVLKPAERNGVQPEQAAASRECTPRRLSRRLSGDLDKIVLKALREDPKNRYESVKALSDDIERHLNGLPVEAQSPSFWYRAGKFAKRNKARLVIATALAMIVGAFLFDREAKQRQVVRERDRAENISAFLQTIFLAADPHITDGEEITALQLLDQAKGRVQDADIEPEVKTLLKKTIGTVYRSLNNFDAAQSLLEDALHTRLEVLGLVDIETARILNELGKLYRMRGEHEKAIQSYSASIEILDEMGSEGRADIPEIYRNISIVLLEEGEYKEAESWARRAIELNTGIGSEEELHVDYHTLGASLRRQGRYSEAEEQYLHALALHRRTQKDRQDASLGHIYNSLGLAQLRLGKIDEAEQNYNLAQGVLLQVYGEEHPRYLTGLNNLVGIARMKRDLGTAEELSRRALDGMLRTLGEDHLETAQAANNLGVMLQLQGKHKEAEVFLRQALRIESQLLHSNHPSVASSLSALGGAVARQGRLREAEAMFREDVGRDLGRLSSVLEMQGRYSQCEPLARRSLEIVSSSQRTDLRRRWAVNSILAACISGLGLFEEAESRALESYTELVGTELEKDALGYLVSVYERWGKSERVKEYKEKMNKVQ